MGENRKENRYSTMRTLTIGKWSNVGTSTTHCGRCADLLFDGSHSRFDLLCRHGFLALERVPVADLHFLDPNSFHHST